MHPAKNILPISLRKGDQDVQPGEIPENSLMWTQNSRPTLYGQWLAGQITFYHAIDPADGVEPAQKAIFSKFNADVIVRCKKKALEEARKTQVGLVLWTDGSKLDQGQVAAAVCWEDNFTGCWKEKSEYLGKNKKIGDAELWAILMALDIASKMGIGCDIPVMIFCDSQKALNTIVRPSIYHEYRFVRDLIYKRIEELQSNGHPIKLLWVPGHSGILGNEKAHIVARNRAEKGGKLIERWSSLAYIRKNVDEIRSKAVAQWHETEIHKREISRRGYYIPRTKESISLALGKAPKKYASRFYQLKVGHGAVGTYLARIGVIEAPNCWWCTETVQSVEHLYAKCRKWRKERRKLVRGLEKEGIAWQPQVERRWLAELLANEKAVAPLLGFLKTTGVGGREGAREREAEWERINDQAGEDLLE